MLRPNRLDTPRPIREIKRGKIRICVFFLSFILLSNDGMTPVASAQSSASRPNVLMIVIDDLNDWVGYLSKQNDKGLLDILIKDESKRIRLKNHLTPNIDKLASRGVAFTDAHANCPVCGPSRVSFLTGLLPSTTGFYLNGHNGFRDFIPQGHDLVTLPQHFKRQGYLTVESGKVFHSVRGPLDKQKSPIGSDPVSWSAQHINSAGTQWTFAPRSDGETQYLGSPWLYQTPRMAAKALRESNSLNLSQSPLPKEQRWHQGRIVGRYFSDFFNWGVLPEPGNPWYSPKDWHTLESTSDYKNADFVANLLSGKASNEFKRYRTDINPDELQVIRGLPEREPGQPFFIAYGGHRPHDPFIVPKSFRDALEKVISPKDLDLVALENLNNALYENDDPTQKSRLGHVANSLAALANLHDAILVSGEDNFDDRYHYWREAVYMYLASINYADACIGRVLEGLDQCSEKDNTIVVLFSDHGWHLGSKEHWSKMTLWQESTHIPMIIQAPGIDSGRCTETVSLVSLFPTLLELTGLEAPVALDETAQTLDGRSLVPLLRHPSQNWEEPVIASYRAGPNLSCIAAIDENWRLIHYKKSGDEELYNRVEDPYELNNLVHRAKLSEISQDTKTNYRRLRESMQKVLSKSASNVAPWNPRTASRFNESTTTSRQ